MGFLGVLCGWRCFSRDGTEGFEVFEMSADLALGQGPDHLGNLVVDPSEDLGRFPESGLPGLKNSLLTPQSMLLDLPEKGLGLSEDRPVGGK
jgi:hypothetical protein